MLVLPQLGNKVNIQKDKLRISVNKDCKPYFKPFADVKIPTLGELNTGQCKIPVALKK